MKEQAEVDLNDELLCAYLDDELDPAGRQRVAAALAADTGAQLRLQRMREADRDLKRALPLDGGDHFEAAMTARIQSGKTPSWRRSALPWATAAAVAGLFAGYLVRHVAVTPRAELVQLSKAMQSMLETRPSGAPQADGMSVMLTFEAQDMRYCRLFRATTGTAGEGLSCRSPEGNWQLVAWDATAATSADGFRPAGASAVTDAAMVALGGEPALDAAAESALMQRGWRVP